MTNLDMDSVWAQKEAQVYKQMNTEFEEEIAKNGVYNTIDTKVVAYKWSDNMNEWPEWVEGFYDHAGILADSQGRFYAKIVNIGYDKLEEGDWLMLNRYGGLTSMSDDEFSITYEMMKT